MCLLKRDQKDTNCGHEECKNFYMLNKQLCLQNLNQQQNLSGMLTNPNLFQQAQNQQRAFSQSEVNPNLIIQQTVNPKRNIKVLEQPNSDDNEHLSLNKKKLKSNSKISQYTTP